DNGTVVVINTASVRSRYPLHLAPVPAAQRRSPFDLPVMFDGTREHFAAFRAQCDLHMCLRSKDFPSEQVRVGFVIGLLMGPAAKWATALLLANNPVLNSYHTFMTAMARFFEAEEQTAFLLVRNSQYLLVLGMG
uniref:DUF4939 domain-containing protein n=1 Tax=Varanus komodoensis TaxID=61221 RepID=A0A8D2L2T9_VARKO